MVYITAIDRPVSYNHVATQNVGRINRIFNGKTMAVIYDYVDYHIPLFNAIYMKRLRLYHRNGYSILSSDSNHTNTYSLIYTPLSYKDDLTKDIYGCTKFITIITTLMDSERIKQWLEPLEYGLDHGITIQVLVTNNNPMDTLVESLHDMGIMVKTISSLVSPCIILDHHHIWYGNIDIFGKTTSNMISRFDNMELANELEHMV